MNREEWQSFRIGRKNDKRIKLTDEQREEIIHRYKKGDIGMRPLARKYGVHRTTIRNVVKPERYQAQLDRYKREKMSAHYYNRDKRRQYMRNFRQHIRELKEGGE